jgi:hypothetical protein
MARRYTVHLHSKDVPGSGPFNGSVTVEAADRWDAEDRAFTKIKKEIVPESKRSDWTVDRVDRER